LLCLLLQKIGLIRVFDLDIFESWQKSDSELQSQLAKHYILVSCFKVKKVTSWLPNTELSDALT